MKADESRTSIPGVVFAAGLLGAFTGAVEGIFSLAFGVRAYGQSAVTRNMKLHREVVAYAMVLDGVVWMLLAIVLLVLLAVAARALGRPRLARAPAIPVLGVLSLVVCGFALALKLRALEYIDSAASAGGILLLALVTAAAIALAVWLRRGGRGPLERAASRPLLLGVACVLVLGGAWSFLVFAPRRPPPNRRTPYAGAAERGGRPNILFAVLDTVRADHCSAYGYAPPSDPDSRTTPALEALAAEGTLFEKAWSPAIWTVAGHASLFTGLYPGTHRADREKPILVPEFRTLAERLSEAGYATGAFSGNPWVSPDNGLARGFQDFSRKMSGMPIGERQREQIVPRYVYRLFYPNTDEPPPEIAAEDVANEANDWLERRRGEARPFFLFVNFFDAHWPYEPAGELAKTFLPEGVTLEDRERLGNLPESELEFGKTKLGPGEREIIRGLYDGDLARADHGLGLVIERLRRNGLLDSTIIVVTADHGEMLGEHGKQGHDLAIYEPLLHVPLVVRWPARFPAATREPKLVQTHDLYPTLLELAGLANDDERTGGGKAPGPDSHSRPLFPETLGAAPRPLAFADESRPRTTLARLAEAFPGKDFSAYDREMRSVTDGRYKAIVTTDGERHLYDLIADPGEENDLALVEPERLSLLAAAIEARRAAEAAAGQGPGGQKLEDLPPEMLDQLRSLGYIK